jgi:hypothetical protein
MGVQVVRREGEGYQILDKYISFYGKGIVNHQIGTGIFVHNRIISADKREEFLGTISYKHKRLSCDIILLNVYARTDYEDEDMKDSI